MGTCKYNMSCVTMARPASPSGIFFLKHPAFPSKVSTLELVLLLSLVGALPIREELLLEGPPDPKPPIINTSEITHSHLHRR